MTKKDFINKWGPPDESARLARLREEMSNDLDKVIASEKEKIKECDHEYYKSQSKGMEYCGKCGKYKPEGI